MEEVTNFDEWIKNFSIPEIKYYAIFDAETSAVIGIYPESSAKDLTNKILIDRELAENIFNGVIPMNIFFVDEVDGALELVQTQTIKTIDDILHRIVDKEYSNFVDPDLIISVNYANKRITFSLSSKIRSKRVRWEGSTEARFIFSEYNDPYKFFQVISIKLEDLYNENLEFNFIGPDKNFSVFTSRIFKKNILEKI